MANFLTVEDSLQLAAGIFNPDLSGTRLLGGVGAGGERPPATRFGKGLMIFLYGLECSVVFWKQDVVGTATTPIIDFLFSK
jgi:hypothetical protein